MKLSILIPVRANLLYTIQCETPCINYFTIFSLQKGFLIKSAKVPLIKRISWYFLHWKKKRRNKLLSCGFVSLWNKKNHGFEIGCRVLMNKTTDYGHPEGKYPSLHGRKFNPNPKFLGRAKAYFVCHIGPILQISLIYAFIGCP